MSELSTNWKTITKKLVFDNKYFHIWEDKVEQPNGAVATYFVNRREPFSIIIPYHDGHVYLVKQYRYSIQTITLEFPMGTAEETDPLEAATRELREETGIEAAQLHELGSYYSGVGRSDQKAYVYLASHLTFGEQQLDEGEFIEVEKYPLSEVSQMIRNGAILDGSSIVAFHFLEEYIKTNDL